MKISKITLLSLLGAVALVLSFLENTLIPEIPFLPVGAKLGLSNVVTMYAACLFSFSGAVYITAVKVLFAFITRGASAAFMSFCGGMLSTVVICLLIKYKDKIFSFYGLGIIGAVAHNLGQLVASVIISGSLALFNYGKYLLLFAIITGSITGIMLLVIMPRLSKINSLIYKY